VSDLAVESTPAVAVPAREAANGQVIYITEHGQRVAGIVSAELASALERLTAGQLEEAADAAVKAGHEDAANFLEDLADRAAVLESRAEGGPGIPWEQVRSEADR
jgi:antitoxin (DNA-binding transcriptional repressor) of toxin-antitoxin stability system